jgi:hypothetical protein
MSGQLQLRMILFVSTVRFCSLTNIVFVNLSVINFIDFKCYVSQNGNARVELVWSRKRRKNRIYPDTISNS